MIHQHQAKYRYTSLSCWVVMCILLAGLGNFWGQSTFSWNGTYGGTGTNRTFTGNAVLGVTMTATIVNSEDVWQESSPRWISSGSTSSLGTSCAALTTTNQGLLLSTNWTTNSTKTITTTINFSSPVQGPVRFFVYDINDDGYGSIHEQVEVSSLNSSNSSLNVSRNTACVPNVSGNNTPTLILNSGNTSSACTCWGNNEVVVGSSSDCISTITIRYRSMTGSYNNPAQYIVISNLTGTIQTATAPTGITGTTTICTGSSTTLTATGGSATSQWFTGSCGGTSVGTGASITVSPTTATTYFVRNFTSPCGFSSCVSTTVNVNSPPSSISASSNSPICAGSTLNLTGAATGNTSWSWLGPNNFSSTIQSPSIPSATTAASGTYFLTAQNSCGTGSGLFDNFSDNNFTSNPVWTEQTGTYQTGVGYLQPTNTLTDERITTPSTQTYGSWQFDFTLATIGNAADVVRFHFISNSTALNTSSGYFLRASGLGTNGIQIFRFDAGTAVALGSFSYTPSLTARTLEVTRSTNNVFRVYLDGALVITTGADGTYTTSTHAGIWTSGNTASTNHIVDNIICSSLITDVTVTAPPTTATVTSTTLSVCGSLTSGSLGGNTPVSGTGSWSYVSGVTGTFSNASSPSSTFTASGYGTSVLRWTISNSPCTASSVDVTVTFSPPIGWANLSFPGSGSICNGVSFDVYGQVFISGVTEAGGQGSGVTAQLGWSTTNSNPSTWTNWTNAVFNSQQGNNDQFFAQLTGLATGTYYYAFRYSINGCPYTYGGTGGVWSSNSGVLTINDCFGTYASAPNLTSCNTTVASQGAFYNSTGSGADMINSAGTNFNSYNFGTYFVNSGGLMLKGAELKTWKNTSSGNVCSARMYYRVYTTGSPSGAFTSINLPYYDGCSGGAYPTGGPCNNGDQKWRDISQNINLTNYAAGAYTLEVYYEITGSHTSTSGCGTTQFLNNNGSNYTATFTLLAAPTASNTGAYCEGTGTVTLSASNGGTSYSWSGPNSFSNATQNPTNGAPSTTNAGTYTVTVNIGGCTQTAQTTVTVNPTPSVIANSNSPICAGQTLNLTSTDGLNAYSWSGPSSFSNSTQNPTLSNFQATNAGTYTVTVTGTGGCTATASTVVALTTSPSAANNGPVCVGGALSLSTNSATSYSWSGPNSFTSNLQNPTVSASATTAMAGTYTVSLVGSCAAATGVVDNFSDGNFTANPVWTSTAGGWQIYNISSTQYLYGDNAATTDVITTPSTQAYGTWDFDFSFQTTASTTAQVIRFFVTASSTGLQTTNGYYVFADGGGNFFLRKLTAGTASNLISSTWTPNTAWHTVKVIREFDNTFKLYLDGVLKGTSAADNSFTTSSFLGLWNTGAFASDNHRVDNISCTPPSTATTVVTVNSGPAISAKIVTICSGNTYTLTTAAPDVVPGGTTYSWTFTANPNITGATTGTAQSSFAQTLTNISSITQTIVYTVTPSAGSCSGTPFTVTVVVDAPLLGGTISNDQTICSGTAAATLTSTQMPSGGNGLGLANSVVIGTQIWMNRNLDVVNYNDGTPINGDFTTTAGAYTWYNNDQPTYSSYGPLYNWFAVNSNKLCPSGWKVPSNSDWLTLMNFVGTNPGNKLKSCRQVSSPLGGTCDVTALPRWDSHTSQFGTNNFGFSALPAGRKETSNFLYTGTRASFWSSTNFTAGINGSSHYVNLAHNSASAEYTDFSSYYTSNNWGLSVRCMGDNATTIQNSYTYQWQQDPGCTGTWSNIAGANGLTYSPGVLTQTTCFRRMTTDGCGTTYSNTVTITVNPAPAITAMTATICSGATFTATPVNGTNGTVPAGTTYTWSAPVLSPASSITGGSAQAVGQSSISQTLTNVTTANATATYTVTPTVGSCPGATFTVTVTVLPPFTTGTVQGITNGSGPSNLVIYQVYGGGGNSGATYNRDFVVLYNPTASAVNLSGWSLQYAGGNGNFGGNNFNLSGTIQSGGYFLIHLSSGSNGVALPTADLTLTLAMGVNDGKITLVNSTTALSAVSCPSSSTIVDFVGYGTANCSEGSSAVGALNATNWATRKLNGCQDTGVNSADFVVGSTTAPRNSTSPTNFCTTTTNTETICAGQNASSITSSAASGANGSFSYQWYSQAGNVSCPTGSSTVGWTPLTGETNLTLSPGAVSATTTYALFVTATGANSCGGAWASNCRVVIVNPTPVISNMTTSVCSPTAFSVTPANGTNGTVPAGTSYSWAAPSVSGITGTAAGTNASSISGTLTNTTNAPITVSYTVTPVAGSCTGTTFTVSVTVNPRPTLSNASISACSPDPFSYTPTGTNVPTGTTYSWSVPTGSNFTGGAAGTGASTVDGTLTLSTGSSTTAVYTVTPSAAGCSGSTFTLTVALSNCVPPTPFSACNLVVYKIGDGSTTLSSAAMPISIEEVSPAGAVVQNVTSLFIGSNLLTQGGTSTSSGFLNSNNGFLAVPGLNSTLGTASVTAENTKVTHIIDGSVTLTSRVLHPTSGTIPFTANTYRSVVPVTASTFYCAGTGNSSTGGVWYYNGTSFIQIYNTQNNVRNLEIFNGNLYFSVGAGTARGVYQLGTGLPTTAGQTASLLFSNDQANGSPYSFSISPDGCTAYLADDGSGSLSLAGITKFSKVAGIWTTASTYTTLGSTRGLVVDYSSNNAVIYATTAPSNGVITNTLVSLTDNGTSFVSNWTLLAGTNYAYAGIDFTPNSTSATISNTNNVSAQNSTVCQNGTATTLTVASATSSNALTYQWYSNTSNDLCGATAISGATGATYSPPTTSPGTTYYFAKISSNCATVTYSSIATVIVNPNPTPNITGNAPLCSGSSITLTANPSGQSYSWSPGGQTTQAISVTSAGNYSVTVTDSNNCSAQASATVSNASTSVITNVTPP